MKIKTEYLAGLECWRATIHAEDGRVILKLDTYHNTEKEAIKAAKRNLCYCPPGSPQPTFSTPYPPKCGR